MPYSAAQMYALVADIPSYPDFLNWCAGARIVGHDEGCVVASITIAYKGLQQSFTTRNRMTPAESIEMELVEGPFSELRGTWRFLPLDRAASKIELELRFAFSNRLMAKLVAPVFTRIANSQVDAFHERAKQLYGV